MKTIEELTNQRLALIQEKQKFLSAISDINADLTHTLPRHEYHEKLRVKAQHVRSMTEIESRISVIKAELVALNQKADRERLAEKASDAKADEGNHWHKEIIDMRNTYQEFAADATRSPTMRRMASEFVMKLTPIIRKMLKKENQP